MSGWHHQLDGHEYEQAPGIVDGQDSLMCCSPWGCKESDMIEQLKNNKCETGGLACHCPSQIVEHKLIFSYVMWKCNDAHTLQSSIFLVLNHHVCYSVAPSTIQKMNTQVSLQIVQKFVFAAHV